MFDIDMGGNWADELLEQMQKPGQREAMKKAFEATPEELGKAAVEFARKEQAEAQREWIKKKYAPACNGCSYGSHCLGADPDCACCKAGDEGCYPK